ncbi:MAG: pyridoxamine 5'-phosphate oxidase [Verrucomicrobia bacterium]|nr:pyridoxamine 5'-phosphate oxidase [Verrucomicrobiota bacterium]
MNSTPNVDAPEQQLETPDLHRDPVRQFDVWFKQALAANLPEPTAMTLATASRDGTPSARIVLLKGYDDRGFTFFTNYESAKGKELLENPRAALVFFWPELKHQIRISGTVSKVAREESETYFRLRPIGSRIGAWASRQSQVLRNREELDQRVAELTRQYEGKDVPLPPHWGGYRLAPETFEFWQGRESRLHDRFRYQRVSEREWKIERLSP